MDKLKLHTPDFTEANIAKIAELFPNCTTESKDDQGNIKKRIDFDQLRQELSDHVVDGPRERYHLDWPGKKESLLAANAPIAKTLRPCREESVAFDTTKNLFIEGDNLDALKLLQETYLNKVKMIYIDPPYNTGNQFIYDDDFSENSDEYFLRSNQVDGVGNRLVANTEANGRFHSDWLSMMYSRLRLARNLLRDDGVIFISIDDNEVDNTRKLCDEIFGGEQFLAQFVWRARQFTDARSKVKISTDHEYIICYARGDTACFRGSERDESKYQNPDNDPHGPWMSRSILGLATKDQRPNLHYAIEDPETGLSYSPPDTTGWRYSKDRMQSLIGDGHILFPSSPTGRPREKKFRADLQSDFTSFPTIIDGVFTSHGTAVLRELFGVQLLDFPKPVELLRMFCEQHLKEDDVAVDFFAGSATTGHAVMDLNAGDGGSRRYILVQLPEDCDDKSEASKAGYTTIAEIAKERIRRAGKKIKEEAGLNGQNLDIGFRVLKVDSSNMKDVYYTPDAIDQPSLLGDVDNIKEGRTDEDLLFQVLLDWGVDLTLPITAEPVAGKNVFFVDNDALAACFEPEIEEIFIKELAKRKPLSAIFRDTGYGNDATKINVEQIFKLISPSTEVKSI